MYQKPIFWNTSQCNFLGERCKSAGKLLNCMLLLPLGWFDWWYASSLLYSFTWCPPMQILVVEWQPNLQHAKTHARQNSWTRMISMFWSSEYSIRRKCNIHEGPIDQEPPRHKDIVCQTAFRSKTGRWCRRAGDRISQSSTIQTAHQAHTTAHIPATLISIFINNNIQYYRNMDANLRFHINRGYLWNYLVQSNQTPPMDYNNTRIGEHAACILPTPKVPHSCTPQPPPHILYSSSATCNHLEHRRPASPKFRARKCHFAPSVASYKRKTNFSWCNAGPTTGVLLTKQNI